jgi:hypothetical protein
LVDSCSKALKEGRFKHFIVTDKANGESAQVIFIVSACFDLEIIFSLVFVVVDFIVERWRNICNWFKKSKSIQHMDLIFVISHRFFCF